MHDATKEQKNDNAKVAQTELLQIRRASGRVVAGNRQDGGDESLKLREGIQRVSDYSIGADE